MFTAITVAALFILFLFIVLPILQNEKVKPLLPDLEEEEDE